MVTTPTPARCHRCVAAGTRPEPTAVYTPHIAPAAAWCRPCLAAVAALLDATTWPATGATVPACEVHTGSPHFLWKPAIGGLTTGRPARPGPVAVSRPLKPGDGGLLSTATPDAPEGRVAPVPFQPDPHTTGAPR